MATKTEIFQDIVKVLANDYAGFEEKKAINCPNNYLITDEMDETAFVQTIQSYLLDFKDGHLSFKTKNGTTPFKGFKVRRYKNALYVTEVQGEQHVQVGDEIVELDGLLIEEFEKQHDKILEDKIHERQYWNVALTLVNSITFKRNQQIYTIDLKNYPRPKKVPEYSLEQLNPVTTYIKLTDFEQSEPIQKLISENQHALNEAQNLIIDVRVNGGGNDLFYFPLLDFIFNKRVHIKDLFEQDDMMYTNYTKNNCDLWITALSEYLEQPLDQETRTWIDQEIKKFQYYRGQGLLPVREELDYIINGRERPANVYILSDVTCGSSGDTFVKNAKLSPKVTVVGRATMGIIDYANVVTKDYGNYELIYSISKMNDKYHCNETGVLPDIHIPWTPKHLNEDVDLEYVLNLCAAEYMNNQTHST